MRRLVMLAILSTVGCLCSSAAAAATTTVFFDPLQIATPVSSGTTSDTISSEGYLFTYTRDKLFTGGTGQVIGRPVRVQWPAGIEAQAVTTPPPGVTDHKARITIKRVDGGVFDLNAFTAKLLANTAGAGGTIEIMPMRNGQDGFNDPLYFDATGYAGSTFHYDTSPNYLGSTALLVGYDTYNIGLYVDFALVGLTLVHPCPATVIAVQPTPAAICSSQHASFSVTASGDGPFTYQWRLNGIPLSDGPNGGGAGGNGTVSGATTASLTVSPPGGGVLGAADMGDYDCVVTEPARCPTTSDPAYLTISDVPTITAEPVDVATCTNGAAVFSVVGDSLTPVSYQWLRDGVPLDPATNPSAATDTLVLTPLTSADQGAYECTITNDCGTARSVAARLTVQAPVAPDLDDDCDVDEADLALLQECAAGPAAGYSPACRLPLDPAGYIRADADHDHDVDQEDFAVWQRCFSGPGVLPYSACDH
jgi:hypothetical protein